MILNATIPNKHPGLGLFIMSTSDVEEGNNNNTQKRKDDDDDDDDQVVVTFASRRLQSFPSPTLEVIVGSEQKLYRYHGIVLALQSGYIDLLLSSPASKTIQETQRITFPDIPVVIWDKMIQLLSPGGASIVGDNFDYDIALEVLPFYDKYQFPDGIHLCDQTFARFLTGVLENHLYFRNMDDVETNMIVMSIELNLPLSKQKALKVAKRRVQTMTDDKKENLQRLLPLVENDETTLRCLASILYGRQAKSMTMDEMRINARQEGFADQILKRRETVMMLEQNILRPLGMIYDYQPKEVRMSLSCIEVTEPAINTTYECKKDVRVSTNAIAGVMKYRYIQKYAKPPRFYIESKDVFGNEWEIVEYVEIQSGEGSENNEIEGMQNDNEGNKEDEKHKERVIWYRWNGGYSSYLAPETGWERR